MDKYDAQELVRTTLQNPFDKGRYSFLIRNLLNHFDETKAFHAHGYVKEKFTKTAEIIKTYERLGTYTDPEGNKIDILIVYLEKQNSLDRARTTLRNFIADYLKQRDMKEAALVAFVSPDFIDWRFSLVKMEYKITQTPSGNIKTKEEFTAAKRFSFLVGPEEHTHTAQSRLVPIIQNDVNSPTLKELEDAFGIEKVTKEFFEKYTQLFHQLNETLDKIIIKDEKVKNDFLDKNIYTPDFAKKLLGQIVFLYFLQKKGWFGVEKNKNWGTGSKKFLRDLFDGKVINYSNFFNDVLEPLFYDALARDKSDIDHFHPLFNCKIPFLNGGLFDPIGNYDWVNTDIKLPDELFSNKQKTKEGDTGSGILDVFDRYNFTVKEDEPLEKEVAVDPEMLGKVFENLLEVKDRKSKGTYYTPREIVHYMCQESLINYIVSECEGKVNKKDVEILVQYGEFTVEHDNVVKQNGRETTTYSFKLPESIRNNAQLIDDKLKSIRVCDPAIGSGAFPVGMMNEIVRTRNTLTKHLDNDDGRSIYDFKRHAIQNSLYGVDTDPGAVEIAKLRLWLSLVVDEVDIQQIKPLPNLDYKIMQGNSLLEEFEGVKLFDEELISKPAMDDDKNKDTIKDQMSKIQKEYFQLHSTNKLTNVRQSELELQLKKQTNLLKHFSKQEKAKLENTAIFDMFSEAKKKAQELKQFHKEFFEASQKTKKDELKKRIENLEWELIETTLKEQNKLSSLKQLEQYKKTNIKPFFLWKLHFSEVFQEKGGFDVVIGNPPYLNSKKIPINQRNYFWLTCSEILKGDMDLYQLFYYKAIKYWLKDEGSIAFVSPDSYFTNQSFSKFRDFLIRNTEIRSIVDFPYRFFPFKSVNTETSIFEATKRKCKNQKIKVCVSEKNKITLSSQKEIKLPILKNHNGFFVNVSPHAMKIIERVADNEFKFKDYFRLSNPSSLDRKERYPKTLTQSYKKCVFEELDLKNDEDLSRICVPCVTGDKILRYKVHGQPLYTNKFWKKRGETRTINSETMLKMESIKLIGQRITGQGKRRIIFTLDETGLICMPSVNIINCNLERNKDKKDFLMSLLGLLNSNLYNYLYKELFSQTNTNVTSEVFEIIPIHKEIFSVRNVDSMNKLVENILNTTVTQSDRKDVEIQNKITAYEKQINQLVYKLYGLTPEEIAVVEGACE